ncbi:hypothetical protein [Prosthecomicrobium sp. N25]|uniref:hypothetical protein n=1 Tax=Prosthecomicrobium sp. N25 TaxID=3129254 RepID=UPI003076FAB7
MSLLKTLPTIAALAWIAGPIVLGASAETPVAAETPAIVKSDRIADAFALFDSGKAGPETVRTITVETRDEANQTSTLTRIPVVETASR